jgi:hypothetical protein
MIPYGLKKGNSAKPGLRLQQYVCVLCIACVSCLTQTKLSTVIFDMIQQDVISNLSVDRKQIWSNSRFEMLVLKISLNFHLF